MKYIKVFYTGLIGLLLAACTNELQVSDYGQGEGRLVLSGIQVETVVGDVITRASLDAEILPEASDFTIEIIDSEGALVKTLEPGTLQCTLAAGTYTLKAIYGDAAVMSATPAFYGEKEVTVTAGQDAETKIEASLVQAVIRPSIDANLEAQFKEYRLEFSNAENETVTLENNKDFFIPCDGTYVLTLSGTNQLNKAFTHTWSYENKFAIRTRYIVACNPDLPSFTLPEQEETNAWATFIYITPMTTEDMTSHQEDMTDKVLANIVYEASSDGTTWIPSETAENGKIVIKDLTPSTTYTIRSRFGAVYSDNTSQLTTEKATEVPNGDFEELTETINMTINQGGRFRETYLGKWQILEAHYNVSEPNGWSSVNAKTCNVAASNQNSWFVVPSTLNTSEVIAGSNAMVLRNVAWDLNGTTPKDYTQTWGSIEGDIYNHNTPSSIANRSAGKLFLGIYSYANGTEIYNEGIDFGSRPISLNGYYKYIQDSNDTNETGTITVSILNNSDIIGIGYLNLSTASDFTMFKVPIVYTNYSLKATQLKIMITSSNYASYRQEEENSSIKTSIYNGRDESVSRGATLTIDNLTFSY